MTPRLGIGSYAQLLEYQDEILQRIEAMPNGGNLFLIHPFRLLADVGVELSVDAKTEILQMEPHLGALSETPYAALKASACPQRYRVHLKGLFKGESA
jgi:hypothetical protein